MVSTGIVLLSAVTFSGCSRSASKNKVPGKSEVMKFVEELCPSEDVDYDVSNGKGQYYGEKQVIYNYSSHERDLDFEVIATTSRDGYITFLWSPVIKENYHAAIRIFYQDEIEAVLDKHDATFDIKKYTTSFFEKNATNGLHESIKLYIDSYQKLLEAVDFCYELNSIYSAEETYNTKTWMEDNPLALVYVTLTNITGNYNQINTVKINGNDDYNVIYNELTHFYKQALYDGLIYDDMVLDDTDMHKSKLSITLDGRAVERNDINGNTSVDAWKTEDFVAKYDYEAGTYYLPLNPYIDSNRNPLLLQLYIECAGGDLKDYSKSATKFTIGSEKYVIDLDYSNVDSRSYINGFTLKKDGNEIDLSVLEKKYEEQYIYWISIDDMAGIFDFDYSIDEENETVDLQFK